MEGCLHPGLISDMNGDTIHNALFFMLVCDSGSIFTSESITGKKRFFVVRDVTHTSSLLEAYDEDGWRDRNWSLVPLREDSLKEVVDEWRDEGIIGIQIWSPGHAEISLNIAPKPIED